MSYVVKPSGTQPAPDATFRGIVQRLAPVTISARLVAIVLTLAVPLNVVVVVVIWRLASVANEEQRTSLIYSARSIASAVDAELGKYFALGQVLSQDPTLLEDSLDAFDDQLRRRLASVPNTWAILADLEERPLLNTAAPHGQPLPARPAEGIAAQKRAFKTHSIIISDVYQGPRTKTWMASASIPIFRNGEPFRLLRSP
jgi:hypothetical protein